MRSSKVAKHSAASYWCPNERTKEHAMANQNAANAEQIEYWNGNAGAMWAKNQDRMDALLAPITEGVMKACDVGRGDHVLDVGCGCGDTTLRLARRGAAATGVDVSQPMLARARERATGSGLDVRFELGDAATTHFERTFDALFSRFGVMFFADPTAAFANMHSALRERGRVCFVCWRPPQLNPWIAVPFGAAQPLLPPQPPVDPRAPGPFAFADPDYVERILGDARFRNVNIEPFDAELVLGHDVDAALAMVCETGPLSRSLAMLEPAQRPPIVEAVGKALAAHIGASGVALGAACWIVRAAA
jgi:SAM-dependent methyltransferase